MRAVPLVAAVLVVASACSRPSESPPMPRTPIAAYEQLDQALLRADWGRVFDLLDRDSRWSLMSIHKDLRQSCDLVKAHYPEDRRGPELARCSAAALCPEARTLFAQKRLKLPELERLPSALGPAGPIRSDGNDRWIGSRAGELRFCVDEGIWGFCNLRDALNQLKIKTARDLQGIQENVETFSAGGP